MSKTNKKKTGLSMAKQRKLVRILHLVTGASFPAYVYSPTLRALDAYTMLLQFVIIPLIVLSGIWLWKGHLIRKRFKI